MKGSLAPAGNSLTLKQNRFIMKNETIGFKSEICFVCALLTGVSSLEISGKQTFPFRSGTWANAYQHRIDEARTQLSEISKQINRPLVWYK